jgi:hypothetical protein
MRAVQELTMLKTDVERERYEARRKAQLDYNTGLKVARLEGREEGHKEGLQRGHVQGKPSSTSANACLIARRPQAMTWPSCRWRS